jgi:trigger factor
MAKKNNNIHEITINIEGEDWKKALDESFKKKVKNVTIDGFRKGKCPRNIYDKKVGVETLFDGAADSVLQTAYTKAIEETKVVPVIPAEVELTEIDENHVTFKFVITSRPEVTVKNYKGLGVKEEKAEVTDEEVEEEVKKLLDKYAELVIKEDGSVETGDLVTIDYEGFLGSEAFKGGKGENHPLQIGSGTFIPGFEEQLIGMKREEEREIKVTFPEDYHEASLKGQEATFKVKVHEIKTKEKRELDQDFFDDLALEGVNDEASLKEEVKKTILAQKEMENENIYIDKLLSEVAKNVEVDIPEGMVTEETTRLLKRAEQSMMMQGLNLDLYYQITGQKEEDLRAQLKDEAYQNVLYRLMLEEITKLEKIEVSLDDAKKEAKELADKYQMAEEDFLKEFGGLDMVQYDLEMRRTLERLKELNK